MGAGNVPIRKNKSAMCLKELFIITNTPCNNAEDLSPQTVKNALSTSKSFTEEFKQPVVKTESSTTKQSTNKKIVFSKLGPHKCLPCVSQYSPVIEKHDLSKTTMPRKAGNEWCMNNTLLFQDRKGIEAAAKKSCVIYKLVMLNRFKDGFRKMPVSRRKIRKV